MVRGMRRTGSAALVILLLVAGCGDAANDEMEAWFESFRSAIVAKDYAELWQIATDGSRRKFGEVADHFRKEGARMADMPIDERRRALWRVGPPFVNLDPDVLRSFAVADDETIFVATLAPTLAKRASAFVDASYDRAEVDGDRAVIHYTYANGRSDLWKLVREDGLWKIDWLGGND